jgi:hypothetical protein
MDPILDYLKNNKLPEDRKAADLIKRKAQSTGFLKRDLSTDGLFQGHTFSVFIQIW